MYQQIIFFFVFTNLNPLGVVGYHVCNNLDFMRNFVIIFTSGCYMKDEVIFMLNLVFALISRRNYGTKFAMYALLLVDFRLIQHKKEPGRNWDLWTILGTLFPI